MHVTARVTPISTTEYWYIIACLHSKCTHRGYGDSERPPHMRDYHMNTLIQDIAELIPALGYRSCVLVAHDWGGIIAW